MNRSEKVKQKRLKQALLVTARARGLQHAAECYRPYSDATNGKRTPEMLAYESGFDTGLRKFYMTTKK